jgi:hypothetical protein
MSSPYLSTTFYLVTETRRSETQARAAQARLVAQARTRQAGLPSYAARAAARHGELLAEAEGYRLAAQAGGSSAGVSIISAVRQTVGSALVQIGAWIQGAATVSAATTPVTTS